VAGDEAGVGIGAYTAKVVDDVNGLSASVTDTFDIKGKPVTVP